MKLLNLVFALFMTLGVGVSLNAMDDDVILVCTGKSGTGKSTIVNAWVNFIEEKKWNDFPKLYPIPTEFQDCNVERYRERAVENHQRGQLEAVTQEASEYVAEGLGCKISLIDCPGTGDPRGIGQDTINTNATAGFLASRAYCSAFCVVVKSTANRQTAEEAYCIEQIKNLLPLKARDRIFIIVTHDTGARENIETFVQAVGLPSDNIFYFDNFGLTKEGHIDLANVDLNGNDTDDDINDPFNEPEGHGDNTRAIAIKTKASWVKSDTEFNRMLRKAKELGSFSFKEFAIIGSLRAGVAHYFTKSIAFVESLEACQVLADNARTEFANATIAKNRAEEACHSAREEFLRKVNEKQPLIRDTFARVDFIMMTSGSWEEGNRLKRLAEVYIAECGSFEETANRKYSEMREAWRVMTDKCEMVRECEREVSSFCSHLDKSIAYICNYSFALDRLVLCSLNSHLGSYYDICIRREPNHDKKKRLNREKELYLDVMAKYRGRKN